MHKLMYDVNEDKETHEITFVKKDSLDRLLKLIVVDEASMVSKEMQDDLESYGKRVLYVGDHGQLPPVGDSHNNLMLRPDIKLEKIHRQAEGDPIIFLAKMVRLGAKLPYKTWGDSVCKIPKSSVTPTMLLNVDQVLCGKNDTRRKMIEVIRRLKGFPEGNDPQVNDRIICLRNNQQKGFVNGLTGVINSLQDFDKEYCDEKDWWRYPPGTPAMNFKDEMENYFYNVPFDFAVFNGMKPDFKNRFIESFDFADCLTVHKSQGSQYISGMVFEEYLGDSKFHAKWMYTAITRMVKGLIIVGK